MKYVTRIARGASLVGMSVLISQAALAADTGQLPCKTTQECDANAAKVGVRASGAGQAHTSALDAAEETGDGDAVVEALAPLDDMDREFKDYPGLAAEAEEYLRRAGALSPEALVEHAIFLERRCADDRWPENDALTFQRPPPPELERWWIGEGAPAGWKAVAASDLPAEAPAYLAANRVTVEKFLRAFGRGAQDYHGAFNTLDASGQHVKGAGYDALAAIIGEHLGVQASALGPSWPYIDPTLQLDANDLGLQLAFWKAHGFADASLDLAQVIDRSFGYVH